MSLIGIRFRGSRRRRGALLAVPLLVLMLLALGGCTGAGRAPHSVASADPDTPVPAAPSSDAAALPLRPGRSTVSLTVGGVKRTARLYVPPSVSDAGGPVPLLVALHGGGGTAAHFEATSGFDALAAQHGFVVAYPQALAPDGRTASWNAGSCCGFAARTDVDDVGFVQQLVAGLLASGGIDLGHVFAAGESNGGMLAYRLACQASAEFAAIGVQSATLEYSGCAPSRPVSLLHIHGTADDHVPLAGGHGSASRDQVDYTAPLVGAATVARADGCGATPAPGTSADFPGSDVYSWGGCPAGTAVTFVAVPGMGHTWQASSAADIWNFLAAHGRDAG